MFNPIIHASATDVNSDSNKGSNASYKDHLDRKPTWTRSSSRSIYDDPSGGSSNSVFNPLLKLNTAVSDVIAPINSAMAPILPRYYYILSYLLSDLNKQLVHLYVVYIVMLFVWHVQLIY